ncbi:hypothetical protein FOCC_FOCC009184 [Frankliniella occidentalis]|nr:hypothetical protein FOCC_FOCC009184 [Frankliniella occidentalis]
MQELISFFNYPKRRTVLMNILKSSLSSLCEARWIERHDGVLQFRTDLPQVSGNTCLRLDKAKELILGVTKTSFLMTLVSLSDVLPVTLPLSKLLQTKRLDVHAASLQIRDVISVLDQRRADSDTNFADLWKEACALGTAIEQHYEVTVPRRAERQLYRDNYDTSCRESYFRISVYNKLLDEVTSDLKDLMHRKDTPNSNTGYNIGAAARIEKALNKEFLCLACRHHVLELIPKALFEKMVETSTGPDIGALCKQLQDKWDTMDHNAFKPATEDAD